MKLPVVGRAIDERFLEHRRRSTSVAGIVTAVLSVVVFEYRYFVKHVWSWDLLAVALTFVVIKMGMMAWYWMKD